MSETKTIKAVNHERRVVCYPPTKYFTMLNGYIAKQELSKSEAVTEIMRKFFDDMPEQKRVQCLNEGIRVTKSKHHY